MDEQKKTSGSLALNGAPQVITIPPSDPVRDRKLRVAAYARVSSGSEDQLNSFAAQNAHYTELITDNPEWEFVDVYADKGITGTSAEKRDDFQRLLADCRRGRVDKILVKSSSRFARNAKECLEAVRELKALGVGVCFEEQGIDTSELAGELLTAIFAMMDQKESENISDNIRWSIQKRMARGTFVPSSLPFGYKKDEDGGIIIDSGRAKYVRQIFSDFLKGYNMQEIAGHMKERQSVDPVLSPYQWKVKSIARILKNEKYAGNSLWQKSFRTPTLPRRSLTNRGELNQYYGHPQLHPGAAEPGYPSHLRGTEHQLHLPGERVPHHPTRGLRPGREREHQQPGALGQAAGYAIRPCHHKLQESAGLREGAGWKTRYRPRAGGDRPLHL